MFMNILYIKDYFYFLIIYDYKLIYFVATNTEYEKLKSNHLRQGENYLTIAIYN